MLGFSTGSSFFTDFLGRVEESIKDKSILSTTLGDSTSGASILTVVGFSTSFSTGLAAFAVASDAFTSSAAFAADLADQVLPLQASLPCLYRPQHFLEALHGLLYL